MVSEHLPAKLKFWANGKMKMQQNKNLDDLFYVIKKQKHKILRSKFYANVTSKEVNFYGNISFKNEE